MLLAFLIHLNATSKVFMLHLVTHVIGIKIHKDKVRHPHHIENIARIHLLEEC